MLEDSEEKLDFFLNFHSVFVVAVLVVFGGLDNFLYNKVKDGPGDGGGTLMEPDVG